MRYEEFKALWEQVFRQSGPPQIGVRAEESIELGNVSRRYEAFFEGRTRPEPFHVSAKVSWRWDALASARTSTTEEDMLTELFGDRTAKRTARPWLRVDVSLHASLMDQTRIPVPDATIWPGWLREVEARMEPLLPYDSDLSRGGQILVTSWRGQPTLQVRFAGEGQPMIDRVELAAWQGIDVPRHWDDPERRADKSPLKELEELARRTGEALRTWGDLAKVLLPAQRGLH